MVLLIWSACLQPGAEAGPEPRITTTPTAAYDPPAQGPNTSATGTTTDLLTFIRALEAPRGYSDYERRIHIPPPKPLTAMTLGEVLDWQKRLRRAGAPSTAAGGYQIIYPTLKRLVAKYGISRSRVFNAVTQDHLARMLISECGHKGPRHNHPRYGNCLAGIWAALPLTHGTSRGRSAHHGVAGNKALTHPATVLALLAGQPVVIPSPGTAAPPPLDPAQAAETLRRVGKSVTQPLAFGSRRITVEEINTAMRKARRENTLSPSVRPSPAVRSSPAVRTWKGDPYAQR